MNKIQHYLFVYGTLMKGLINHQYLINQEFICEAEILDFGLYNVTENYPGIIRKQNSRVKGELYKIEEDLLKILDEFEGEEYTRIEVDVLVKENKIRAFTYLWLEDVNDKDYICYNKQPWKK
ncbi:branched-chain alpha-keto acid dehydrogenase [Clostridium polyendosporum]|uniref:Putative gamma-glutamylcyclotransferase n=1 Tax=Clostridium polyendosporum TaxID=69208 RepID=A0A919S2F9_9CLOT|nr:gamma-glutamylcyclotransferase family protein [Clostridium polyendosporum]GIM30010.1 branched-chain alpha-keto acid dehydrogenase [Clostridium polyendosporum]